MQGTKKSEAGLDQLGAFNAVSQSRDDGRYFGRYGGRC